MEYQNYLFHIWTTFEKCTSAVLAASLLVNTALARAAFNDIADYFWHIEVYD
ncbi:hypothetical protein JG559_07445 [Enterococcus faecalis]|uniref:Uncharacterized protein n=1 Tax=Enterococcus faecalis TaxID=1351 RepID=A0A974NZ92_ENTFL|nr:hypothetical protein JG559_07445 [Enterococcus faecalis]